LFVPPIDNHTPSTAQIVVKLHGKELKIDFLGAILGVQDRELRRRISVSVFEVPAEIDGSSVKVLLKVLHPVLCLKSRIISMLHPATRRAGRIAQMQAEAAIVIVRCFINDALGAGDWKEARDCFNTLYWYLRSDPYVKISDTELQIDALAVIRAFVHDERIDQRYREMQLQKMITNIERRRAARR
jgi:hypothetical protein